MGGGIGGLALAIALLKEGIECEVFERDKSFAERSQGYGLTMQQVRSRVLQDAADGRACHLTRSHQATSTRTLRDCTEK